MFLPRILCLSHTKEVVRSHKWKKERKYVQYQKEKGQKDKQ
jgi:hypothetical protein